MFRGDWSKRIKVGLSFGLPIAALSLTFIAWGLLESAKYQREADNHAGQYAEYARDKVEQGCVVLTPLKKRDCINEAREKQRQGERDEQDLVAQRQSALWAYIMGAAAVIGMGLSAVGVYLVWTTFRATRASVDIALLGVKATYRPVLTITFSGNYVDPSENLSTMGVAQKAGRPTILSASVKVQNTGDHPATIRETSLKFLTTVDSTFTISDPDPVITQDFHFLAKGESGFIGSLLGFGSSEALRGVNLVCFLTPENLFDFKRKPPPIAGYIIYDDAIGVRRKKGFGIKPNTLVGARSSWTFGVWGGDEYNYEKELPKA